jgi:16S rRNA (guanine527-N7)-methyltransferase
VTTREFQERLHRRAKRAGVALPPVLADSLETYLRLLSRWNEKINLTALHVSDPDDQAIDRLLIEPLIAASHLDLHGPAPLLDLGSGSGSPAIPLALASGQPIRMVESKVRKAAFLSEAVRQLGMTGSSVETSRFEQLLTRPELHEAAQVLSIRAVRVDARTLLTLQAFLRPEGRVFWFRGSLGPAAQAMPPPLRWIQTVPLPGGESNLVILSKDLLAARQQHG